MNLIDIFLRLLHYQSYIHIIEEDCIMSQHESYVNRTETHIQKAYRERKKEREKKPSTLISHIPRV